MRREEEQDLFAAEARQRILWFLGSKPKSFCGFSWGSKWFLVNKTERL